MRCDFLLLTLKNWFTCSLGNVPSEIEEIPTHVGHSECSEPGWGHIRRSKWQELTLLKVYLEWHFTFPLPILQSRTTLTAIRFFPVNKIRKAGESGKSVVPTHNVGQTCGPGCYSLQRFWAFSSLLYLCHDYLWTLMIYNIGITSTTFFGGNALRFPQTEGIAHTLLSVSGITNA